MTEAEKIAALRLIREPAVCGYWKVTWNPNDSAQDRYYSDSKYSQMSPFFGVGVNIEARVKLGGKNDTIAKSTSFEINPDLKSEKIGIEFDDIDKVISGRFHTYKSGVRAELFFYWPDVDLTLSQFFGQLVAPDVYGYKTLKTYVTNGTRSREQLVGKRPHSRECSSNWGGFMKSTFASESNGCPAGPFGTVASSDLDCPRDSVTTCNRKLGTTDGRYFLGFPNVYANIPVSQHDGGIAISRGGASSSGEPMRVIFGQKYLRQLPLLGYFAVGGNNNAGSIRLRLEVGEGPISSVYAPIVNGLAPAANQFNNFTNGTRGQAYGPYPNGLGNFSCTAYFTFVLTSVNVNNYNPTNISGECRVTGYAAIAVFTDATTYARQWTDSRVWCLGEIYTNQRWGMANPATKLEILDWIDEDARSRQNVSFTVLYADGETQVISGRRTTFDCTLEARPVAEQVDDICRSGALAVPFQNRGKYTIRSFRAATSGELAAARVFSDNGTGKNIIWGDGQPAITLSQIPDDKVVNEIELKFEEASNTDTERTAKFDDPNQKLRAGRVLGNDNLQSVPKRFAAFGIRYIQEVARLGYRLLRFGEFDQGGTQNNLSATFTAPMEQILDVKRYDIIKIHSSLLAQFTIGTNNGAENLIETPELFRVLKIKKVGNGNVDVTCQAYNRTAYEAFETVIGDPDPGPPDTTPSTGGGGGGGGCRITPGGVAYNPDEGTLTMVIPIC